MSDVTCQVSYVTTSSSLAFTFCGASHHWCIKSICNGFAIAIDCTLKVVPFDFCFVQVMSLFQNLTFGDKNWLAAAFFGLRHI